MGIRIINSASYLPETVMTNSDFEKFIETNDEWITTRTGIKERRIATGETTWALGAKAAMNALDEFPADKIGLIIVSSITSDYNFPSAACMIQRALGAKNAACLDVSAACSGFVYALDIAEKYMTAGIKYALVIAAEKLSAITDYSDRSTCVLFGDGAGAFLVENSDDAYGAFLGSDGEGGEHLYSKINNKNIPPIFDSTPFDDGLPETDDFFLHQNGKEVYKFATAVLPHCVTKSAKSAGVDIDKIDFIVPHQANIRIIETAAKNLKIPMEKFIITVEKFGNTSSASIPMAFVDGIETGQIRRGQTICLAGFGAGLTYAGITFKY